MKRMVPVVGSFFTPIRLVDAFQEYDEFFALSRRRYVSPNFAELRHVLNIAQVSSPPPALNIDSTAASVVVLFGRVLL